MIAALLGLLLLAPAALPGAHDLGPAPPGARMQLAIGLPPRDRRGLDALVDAQADPASPLYRHFLTSRQLRAAFSPSDQEYAKAIDGLRSEGFSIAEMSPNRFVLDVTAPVAVVERYLSTTIDRFAMPDGTIRYANARAARIPDDLYAVVGLSEYVVDPAAQALRSRRGTRAHRSQRLSAPLFGRDGGYGPPAIVDALDLPLQHGYSGKGVSVADIMDGTFSDTQDIAPYLRYFKATRSGSATKFVNARACAGSCTDDVAATFDAEQVVGVAPGVNYMLYEMPQFQLSSIVDQIDRIVSDDTADIAMFNFVTCEKWAGEVAELTNLEFEAGSSLGITFIAEDQGLSPIVGGALGCYVPISSAPPWYLDTHPAATWPGDSPYVLGVAGVDYTLNAKGQSIRAPIGDWISNGGASNEFVEPHYQTGLAGIFSPKRNMPDVAGPAVVDGIGPSVYSSTTGGWVGGQGQAPFVDLGVIAGALAEVDEMHHGRMGLINAALYATYAREGYRPGFVDITAGCNGAPFTTAIGPYCAARGYDHVSGIGALDVYRLAESLK